MPENPITVPLPQDLPTNWTYGQIIGPNGTDVGLTQQHGYNYLMGQVNAAQQAAKETGEALGQLSAADIGAETPAGAQQKADAAQAAAIAASDPKGSAAAVSSGVTDGTIKAAEATAADTAAKLTTERTIALSGGATGTATGFDGSENITIEVTSLDLSKTKVINIPNDGTADLKNFTESGIYRGLGGSFVDRPVGMATSYGTLVVFNATTYIQQYYSCLGPGNTSQVFFRQKTSTWGEWIGLHTANGYLQDVMTEAEYVALPKKDPLTIYNLVG